MRRSEGRWALEVELSKNLGRLEGDLASRVADGSQIPIGEIADNYYMATADRAAGRRRKEAD